MNVLKCVKRAKKGNKEAFSRLIQEYEQTLYRVSFSILHSDADCADAIQETILKAYRSIGALREPKYFKTWLTRILMNECYQILRQRKKVVPIEKWVDRGKEDQDYALVEMEEAVSGLPDDLRMVIVLFYFEDLPLKAIAEVIECPEGTVKTRLRRARNQLEEMLSPGRRSGRHEQS